MLQPIGLDALRRQFEERFGGVPRFFQAPGRVNIIGEHTDYNDGFVLPAAVDMRTRIAANANNQQRIRAHSLNMGESAELDLSEANARRRDHWSDYVFGVAVTLARAGYAIRGADLLIESTVPVGSGLSSSAAIEVATAFSLLSCSNLRASPLEIALLCQQAENEFVGARVGVMDQLTSCLGRSGRALLIDCRSLAIQHVPLPQNASLVVCNTMVRHSLASGEYNLRREQCEQAVQVLAGHVLGLRSLRDLSPAALDRNKASLSELLYRRCHHVVTENQRVLSAAAALERGDILRLGELLRASHASLRDDYEVSCTELDIAVEVALSHRAVYGSRMMGGGFGGCTISVVESAEVDPVIAHLRQGYRERTGIDPELYRCSAGAGASEEFQ